MILLCALVVCIVTILAAIDVNLISIAKTTLVPVFNNIEKDRIINNFSDYDELITEHFIIKYDDQQHIAELTGEILEKYYEDVCQMYRYYPENKSIIFIHNDEDKLLDAVGLNKGNAPLGVYYSGTIHVLNPNLWVKDNNRLETIYEKKGPIVHEFTHLIVDDITNGNYPMWFTEGLALYTEYKLTGFEWGKENMNNHKVNIKDLNDNFNKLDVDVAYRNSFELVKDITDIWGFNKVIDMLQFLGDGNDIRKSTKAALKINFYDLKNVDRK